MNQQGLPPKCIGLVVVCIWFWDCRWFFDPLVEVCLLCLVAETVNWWILDCLCLDKLNNCQQRARLSSFDAKIVCQGIEPIPQIFDSSSMLSYSIDIQLAKILRPWNTVGFEIFQLPKVWFFLNHPCWTWLERSTFPWIFYLHDIFHLSIKVFYLA